jgi:hypothetical protein
VEVQPRPVQLPDHQQREQTVRAGVSRGVRFERVRVVPDSMTDYQRFLLHQARFNVEYGEDVRYLRRARADALDLPDRPADRQCRRPRAMDRSSGCPGEIRAALLADLRSMRVEYATWRRQFRQGGSARLQRAQVPVEAGAAAVRVFEPSIVPGLLQSPDYARYIFRGLAQLPGRGRDIDEGVHARMLRQEILYQPGKDFRFLVTEAAMRYLICPRPVLRTQLERLAVMSALPTVDLAVIPMNAALPHMFWHGFWIFDEVLVLVETVSSELSLRDSDDIETYTRFFESFWQAASHGEDAVAIVHRLLDAFGTER